MKKMLSVLVLLALCRVNAAAQDAFFSQYMAAPFLLNPSMAGLVEGDVRGAATYRSQWRSVSPNPYRTLAMSYDMGLMKHKLPKGDAMGVGFVGLYDRSGSGGLTNTTAGLSLAYHKAFGKKKLQHLSFGIQASLVTKEINFNRVTYQDLYNNGNGTIAYPLTVMPESAVVSYGDYNAGIMYSGRVGLRCVFYGGYSLYHIGQPVEVYLFSDSVMIRQRHSVLVGWNYDINKNVTLYTNGLYQAQAGAQEVILGASGGFVLNPGNEKVRKRLYAGGWYRYLDAVCPYLGFEWHKVRLGLSYDFNVSTFTPATRSVGAFEISLTYNGMIKGGHPDWHCPRLY